MRLRFFTVTMLITRPLGIIPTCYLGSGTLIPYSGWGLIVWGILISLMVVLIVLSWKYQDRIEQFTSKISEKMSKKEKIKQQSTESKTIKQNDLIDNDKKDIQENWISFLFCYIFFLFRKQF